MINTQVNKKKQISVWCVVEVFPFEMAWHYSKNVKLFHQTSMRFHCAMATLESQNYDIARTVLTENTLQVSGRLVWKISENMNGKNESTNICTYLWFKGWNMFKTVLNDCSLFAYNLLFFFLRWNRSLSLILCQVGQHVEERRHKIVACTKTKH